MKTNIWTHTEEELRSLVGSTVRLKPFPEKEWYRNWYFYNDHMARTINNVDNNVEILALEYELGRWIYKCRFADGSRWYVVYEWIDFDTSCLFI